MDAKTIGNRIKLARKARNMTQEDVAKELGLNKSTIQRYETGNINAIKLPVIAAIARILQVNPAWLSGKTDKMEVDDNAYIEYEQSNQIEPVLSRKDERDIAKKLEELMGALDSKDGLMFDGEPLDDETRELLRESLKNQLVTTKLIAKQKFTPKKYRK